MTIAQQDWRESPPGCYSFARPPNDGLIGHLLSLKLGSVSSMIFERLYFFAAINGMNYFGSDAETVTLRCYSDIIALNDAVIFGGLDCDCLMYLTCGSICRLSSLWCDDGTWCFERLLPTVLGSSFARLGRLARWGAMD